MSLSSSQSNLLSKRTNKNSIQDEQNTPTNKNNNKENPLIIIRRLYPKLNEEFFFEENNITIDKSTLILKEETGFQEKENILSENFLQNLIKRPCPLDKDQIISDMSKFIQNTTLIQKIQKEFQSDKKSDINELSIMCAEILNYIELKRGKILFRIGDIGDRFYFILKGKVSILKLKEIPNIKMTYHDYIDYCFFLLKEKEIYIFNEILRKNENILALNSEQEVKAIHKILFLKKLKQRLIHQLIPNIKSLYKYLEKSGYKDEDFEIQKEELEQIENNNFLKNKNKEFNNYLLMKCEPKYTDLVYYEPYESIIDSKEKHSITCFCYESFLFLGKGLFFGDFALDSEINKRNATIRAEEDTILGYLKSVDYINIFAPQRKIEKLKEINFLYNNYFFGNINTRLFEKNYFHLFSPHEYIRNTVLFLFGASPKSLILLKEGKVSLELKASIIDLHNLIKYLWDNIYLSKWYKNLNNFQKKELISNNIENKIKQYIDEPIFTSLKILGEQFIKEMNEIKIYQVSMLTCNEIIGLEELYLDIPYIMKGTVIDNKLSCFEITVEHFEKFVFEQKQILYPFIRSSINKIISLIERLQNFKKNGIYMTKKKFEKENPEIKLKTLKNDRKIHNFYNKINRINKNKEKCLNKLMKKINNEERKTININKYNEKNNDKYNKDNTLNKRYKSPVKFASTNLIPVINVIKQKTINKNISSSDNKLNKVEKRELINNKDNNNYMDNNNDVNNIHKNYGTNSSSTEVMPSLSDMNLNINSTKEKVNTRTIYELKKQLQKVNIIEFENNEILNLNKGYNDSQGSYSYNNIFNKDNNNKIENNKKYHSKIRNFHLSYVPLNVLSPKGRLLQRNNSSIFNNNILTNSIISNSIINNILISSNFKEKKKIFKFNNLYTKKKNFNIEEDKQKNNISQKINNINNIYHGKITNGIKNINNVNINKALTKYIEENNEINKNANKYDIVNNKNETIKQNICPDMIKKFYNEIKKRGYSCFIHNKEKNTIFNRKYKRKYGESSSLILNKKNRNNPNKNSEILPKIKERSFISNKVI